MTLLSQQLQKLSLPQDQIKSGSVHHSSLIFTSRVASDHDIEEIFDIGLNGLEELISLNPVFEQYKETLFHPSTIKFERMVNTAEFLRVVDRNIESFLARVADYSLLAASYKALEWLVRGFKIHLHNADTWLAAFIPVHDTNIFPKLLEIVHLPESWMWLQKAKSNTSLLSKEDLVQMCVSYPEYLTAFVDSSQKMLAITQNKSKCHLSFLVSLVFLALERFDTVPADVIPRLYLCIIATITSADKEIKSGGYIIAAQLVRKLTLKTEIVDQLIETVCKHPDDALQEEQVMILLSVVYHQKVQLLPSCCTDLLLSQTFLLAVQIVNEKNDISALLKSLVLSVVHMVFDQKYQGLDKVLDVFKISGFPEGIAQDVCDLYFKLYFAATEEVRGLEMVEKLGELLAECFTKQIEVAFQSYETSEGNVEVLERLKHLIIGTFSGDSGVDKEVLEMHHNLPGIRMLGVLKLSEKLQSGGKLTEEDQSLYITSIVARLEDDDSEVFLKCLELAKAFTAVDNSQILSAVISKVQSLCGDVKSDKSVLAKTLSILSLFPASEDVGVAMMYVALNYLPYLAKSDSKSDVLATMMAAQYEPLQQVGSALSSSEVTQYSDIATVLYNNDKVIQCLAEYPTRECTKILCLLALEEPSLLSPQGLSLVLDTLLNILTVATQRKIEYRESKAQTDLASLKELLYNKGAKLFKQFDQLKKDWEMVHMVLAILRLLVPCVTARLQEVLLALSSLPAEWGPMAGEVVRECDTTALYTVILQITKEGSEVTKGQLKVTLEHFKTVVLAEWKAPMTGQTSTPLLLSLLASTNKSVQKWCRVLLKSTPAKRKVLALIASKLSKGQDKFQIQQVVATACNECSDSSAVASLIKEVYSSPLYFDPLLTLFHTLQHVEKLTAVFDIILSSPSSVPDNLVGLFNSATADMISQNEGLTARYQQCVTQNMLMLDTFTPEFMSALEPSLAQSLLTAVIKRVERYEEHVRASVKQAMFFQSAAVMRPVLIALLTGKESGAVVTFCLEIAAVLKDPEMSNTLFDVMSKVLAEGLTQEGLDCAEYVITALVHTCDTHGKNAPLTTERVQQIVQLIRDTNKHSLHHQCLILLSKLARYFPKLVLDHVMSIFTFMGDSALRRDDSYSIQVVMETISTVIPVISKTRDMVGIVRVFCDSLPHIPSHRQLPVFKLLLETVGASQHLANVFLFVLEYCSREREESTQCSHFLQTLTTQFGLAHLLTTSSTVVECLFNLPDKLDTSVEQKQYKVQTKQGIELQFNDMKHYNYFRLGLATQLYLMVGAKTMIAQITDVGADEEKKLVHLIETCLSILIHQTVVGPSSAKFSDMYCKRLSGIISTVTLTLPSTLFISVIKALLSTSTPLLHTKSLEILSTRAKSGGAGWSAEFEESIISLCPLLLDLTSTQPTAWTTLQNTANKIGAKHPAAFLPILAKGVTELGSVKGVYGCVEECLRQLGARAVPQLKPLVTQCLLNLDHSLQLLKATVEVLAQFLSPHVKDIVVAVSLNWSDSSKDLMKMLGEHIHLRVLLAALIETAEEISVKDPHCLYGVIETCTVALQVNSAVKIKSHIAGLCELYTKLLGYRHSTTSPLLEVESAVVESFVVLTYKLTEKEFLPLLTQLVQWSEGHTDKATAFYHLCSELANKLKGLFILFAGHLFNNLLDHLKTLAPVKPDQEEREVKRAKVSVDSDLLKYTLLTTHKILLYDTKGFTTPERFNSLLEPLSNQLLSAEREGYRELVTEHIAPTLSQLPIAANTDHLWKAFNYHILTLSKDDNPKVRKSVLTVYSEFVTKLGQDISSLLPDALPFLSELLEDPDAEVEKMSEDIVKKIEKITGESLDQHL